MTTVTTICPLSSTTPPLPEKDTTLLKQFPEITGWEMRTLEVEKGWRIGYTEVGNPNGIPVLFVPGGPGYEFNPSDLCWFDPAHYRIIAANQRGCGFSYPSAKVIEDGEPIIYSGITIDTDVADIEKLRAYLNVDQWVVFGGSWGSALSLYYAQKHPQSCAGLVLRGIFLATEDENKAYFNPELLNAKPNWNPKSLKTLVDYAESKGLPFDLEDSHQCVQTYKTLVIDRNDFVAAHLWIAYETYMDDPTEANLNALLKLPKTQEDLDPLERSQAIFETLFFSTLPKQIDLLSHEGIMALKDLKIRMVQGLDDTETPPIFAEKLMLAFNHADIDYFVDWIEQGTHTPYSERMTDALIHATNSFIS